MKAKNLWGEEQEMSTKPYIDKNGPVAPGMKTPCWIWTGVANNAGYYTGTRRNWEKATGKTIPKGYDLDHLCETQMCCRPDHLECVSHAANLQRRIERGRTIRTPGAAISDADAAAARGLIKEGWTDAEIAKQLGVRAGNIWTLRKKGSRGKVPRFE